jgi:hypothetical protein
MSKKLEAFIAYTKKVYLKKDKDNQLSLFDEIKDQPPKLTRYLPVYGWKRK